MKPIYIYSDMGGNICDMTWAIPQIRYETFGYLHNFKIDMGIVKIATVDMTISLIRHSLFGTPPPPLSSKSPVG